LILEPGLVGSPGTPDDGVEQPGAQASGDVAGEIHQDRHGPVGAHSGRPPDGRGALHPWGNGTTYVEVTEDGLCGEEDEILAHATGSTGGFTIVLCALKALLEHDVILTAVLDRFPQGLEH
jgi:hypothetical protein